MRLIDFSKSPRPGKRYVAKFMSPDRTIHFGHAMNTFVDHGNPYIRDNYIMRKRPFPGVSEEGLTAAILWGPTVSVEGNLEHFLRLMKISDERG